jgi:hypothetical protein
LVVEFALAQLRFEWFAVSPRGKTLGQISPVIQNREAKVMARVLILGVRIAQAHD